MLNHPVGNTIHQSSVRELARQLHITPRRAAQILRDREVSRRIRREVEVAIQNFVGYPRLVQTNWGVFHLERSNLDRVIPLGEVPKWGEVSRVL